METVRPNELKAFFIHVTETLERLGIPYMVVGGFAAIFYGEARMTIDIDIVADIQVQHILPLIQAFPFPQYYVSEEAIRDSLQRRYPFNILQPSTGAKVDLVPLPADPFTRIAFQRRQKTMYDGATHSVYFISVGDIIIAKLLAYRETGSDKHCRMPVASLRFNGMISILIYFVALPHGSIC